MGTDITVRVEAMFGSRWQELAPPNQRWPHWPIEHRNYPLFGALAGVRGRNKSVFRGSPRGVPSDYVNFYGNPQLPPGPVPFPELRALEALSDERGPYNRFLGDHNFGWLTLKELRSVSWDYRDDLWAPRYGEAEIDWDWASDMRLFLVQASAIVSMHQLTDDHLRVVFGFDS